MAQNHPIPFILAASDHGPLIVSRFDRNQLANGGLYGVGYQILETGSYDASDIEEMKNLLSKIHASRGPGAIAIDCGANIGVMTLELAKHMRGWGQVFSFEAQERLFYALCGNVALANAFNVQVRHNALGAEVGQIQIPQVDYLSPGSYGSLELKFRPSTEFIGQKVSYQGKNLVTINQISIDSLNLPRLDFLKIDVEGMELDVLNGARETIDSKRPLMWIEWIKSDRAFLDDFLLTRDYKIETLGGNLVAIPKEFNKES